jgi:5-methylcytosine-specific restriction endonuclease McrA
MTYGAFVWRRDGRTCVQCAAVADLEFDHIFPLALGGANTARNLQLLCAACNRLKGGTLA